MPDRPDLADRLLAPEAYPHAVVTPIRVVETHISRVLLTGAYAYKIKKPVRLSFLDYSTLAKRRACCEEEVRLNRRYAPDLYLGVSTVGGPATAPRIDGGGEPIEYAVRMRQFDRHDELGALLATRGVDAAELAALGEHVARFHASAAPVVADEHVRNGQRTAAGHPGQLRQPAQPSGGRAVARRPCRHSSNGSNSLTSVSRR